MNNENSNLIKTSREELIANFRQQLKKNACHISYHQAESSIFGLVITETSLTRNNTGIVNLESTIKNLVQVYHNSCDINWAEVSSFIARLSQINQERALISFCTTLNSTQNTYQNLIQTMENEFNNQLSHEQRKNHDLLAKITALQNKAQELINLQQRIHNNNHYLPSQERISLENLRFKFALLSQQTKSQQAEQELLKQHCQDLENSLQISELNLQSWEKNLQNVAARCKEAEIKLALAEAEVIYLNSVTEGLEQARERINQNYLTEAYNVTKLTNLLIKLNDLLEDLTAEQAAEVQALKKEINKTIGELRMNKEDLEKLTKINFLNKIKLSALLALDSSRSFLPDWYGRTLTSLETTILVGQATQSSPLENTAWILVFLFVISSLTHSFSKLIKFAYRKLSKKTTKSNPLSSPINETNRPVNNNSQQC